MITADEVESFDTLDQMAAASDAVIRGRFVEALPDRVVQGDASEDRVAYARAAFAVDEAIAGKSTPAVIIVELLTNGDTAEVPIAETQVLLFAHEKLGKGEAGVFRPITSNGLLVEDEGARVSAPLAEDSDRTLEWITTEIGGSTLTLERVVAEIS